ncbi:MAG: BglII/BstYI family type II restriction endonuclease [Methanocellales archaeon]|nr:BglII/BstYI family type II restriction endonuclease [Methanocellales archaeon]MDD3291945.1 BglII/BstYI family type II restriction endonuclease [Methanocellales archaeon]MDD5235654.1 BglII/BstYI family type II restriction endonuclease [Methanocellales archaeon]MDD5485501.1 BglII/BstYI family type II restriction endonuclease [Methanocellales archaeon]
MEIIAEFSFKNGKEFIGKNHKAELKEIKKIISSVDASLLKTKISKEKTMNGKALYSPKELNKVFDMLFKERGWKTTRISVETEIPEIGQIHKGFREMDAVKNKLGVEVQFGKYAFMVYNVCAKMTIFAKQEIIDSGVEIVPMLSLAREMSSGVSYFEQMKTDLECRGESNIDIPTLILGVDVTKSKTVQK